MLQTQSKNMKNWSSSVDTGSGSVDTRDSKNMKNWSSSVDTGSGSVDTRDRFQKTFWKTWDSSVDTRSGSVDTRDLPRTPSGLYWDSVSTLPQVVSTLVALPEQNTWAGVTRKHVLCSDSLSPLITL
ncbi:hypothetical protein Taro_043591 [Colocasia esculenta]|uniref:Uncharacterized protein n=1 Tax=Colocasia esculenta TaxID=4460 RepID=A0A843WJT3_COLES|nr:hypothetical protein [Colocasia esculenta]